MHVKSPGERSEAGIIAPLAHPGQAASESGFVQPGWRALNSVPAGARSLAGLLVVGLGAALPPLDLAVNVAFPAITAAFDLELQSIRWVVAAYVLTYASLMLAFGKLGDIVGHRRVFRAGLVLGAAAFVLCALAPDYGWLLAARMVQGVAAALLVSCAPALATSFFDESRRIWVLGAYASMGAAAGVVAPVLGGASIALLGWPGVFWLRVPIAVLTLALLPLVPKVPQPPLRGLDFANSSLLAAALALLLLAPTLVQSGDSIMPSLAAALAGVVLLVFFARRQRNAVEPLVPGAIARDPDFVLHNVSSVVVHLVSFAIPLLVPYYLTRIAGYGPLEAGSLLTLWPAGTMIGSALAAPAARALGRRRTALLGGALVAIGQFAIACWPAATPLMLVTLLLHGAGVGLFQVAYTDIVIAELPRHERGVAGSLTILTRTIGIMLGASVLTAALHALEARQLDAGEPARQALLHAFGLVFLYSAIAFSVFFALASLRRRAWAGH